MASKLIIYRTRAALEIQPDRERGAVFLSFAQGMEGNGKTRPKKGERRYRWEEKIIFALSPEEATDLALAARLILDGKLEEGFELYHDPAVSERAEGEPKKVTLRPGGEGTKAPAFLTIRQGETSIAIALGRGDLFRLEMLLPLAVAGMLGWSVQ